MDHFKSRLLKVSTQVLDNVTQLGTVIALMRSFTTTRKIQMNTITSNVLKVQARVTYLITLIHQLDPESFEQLLPRYLELQERLTKLAKERNEYEDSDDPSSEVVLIKSEPTSMSTQTCDCQPSTSEPDSN
jgi:hypothetical protein